jgi:predicted nuclease of predicted toxin-antitoxin system
MIYLIDNQLPLKLVEHLQTHGLNATHVSHCGLDRATDGDLGLRQGSLATLSNIK